MLGFDDYGVVLFPCFIYLLASSFPVCFCSCSFLLPLWLWESSPMEREPPLPFVFLCFSHTHGRPIRRPPGLCPGSWGSHSSNRSHSVSLSTLLPYLESSLCLPPSHSHSLSPPPLPSTADRAVPICCQPLRVPGFIPALCLLFLGSRTSLRAFLFLNRIVNLEATGRSPSLGHISYFLERLRQKLCGSDSCLCRGLSVCDRHSHLFISQSLC